jgi:hypothetical protein
MRIPCLRNARSPGILWQYGAEACPEPVERPVPSATEGFGGFLYPWRSGVEGGPK